MFQFPFLILLENSFIAEVFFYRQIEVSSTNA